MLEWFIENGRVDQYEHAGVTIWDLILEQIVSTGWDTILPWFGFFTLFVYRRTRVYAIGSVILTIFAVL